VKVMSLALFLALAIAAFAARYDGRPEVAFVAFGH